MPDSPRSSQRPQGQPEETRPDLQTRHPNWRTLVADDAQPWQTLGSQQISARPHLLNRDRVRTQAGTELEYLYRPRGPRAVFVLPVTAAGEVVLIRQYRYPLRAWITEVPAGGMEEGEDVLQSAARELMEEVGGQAQEWIPLPAFYPQPSVSGAVFYPLLALGVTLGEARPEPDELIERLVLPASEAYRRLLAGEILQGPGGLVLFHARRHLEARGFL
ncbi:NUDIX hydrolase [Deinococcus radiomollis]|uniref:NUDIX domain-containing protein n=1 Tax=Deinococcus radiomollis TaxID=468916 RepID=UPI00389264AB